VLSVTAGLLKKKRQKRKAHKKPNQKKKEKTTRGDGRGRDLDKNLRSVPHAKRLQGEGAIHGERMQYFSGGKGVQKKELRCIRGEKKQDALIL